MNGDDHLEMIKSPIWLGGKTFNVPLPFLTDPPDLYVNMKSIKFGYFQDSFDLHLSKFTNDRIIVTLFRTRLSLDETHDDGYMLRFYITMIGFDEETKVALMRHDQGHVCANFMLTPKTKSKFESPTAMFEIFVMAQMLELKSLDASDKRKMFVEETLSRIENYLTPAGVRTLGTILKRPGLDDYFTGRMPLADFKKVMIIATLMMQYYAKIIEYKKAKAKNKDTPEPDFDMGKQLNYIAIGNKENTIAPLNAVRQFMISHRLGLNFFRNLVFEYLMKILDQDFMVLDILEAAIVLHDEELFERAIPYFIVHFYEIIDSARFASFGRSKGYVTRLILHEAHRWVDKKGIYIPGWKKRTAE